MNNKNYDEIKDKVKIEFSFLLIKKEKRKMNIEKRRITVQDAAKLMGKSEMYVRIGLQRGILKFGTAIKLDGKTKYSYHISPKLFEEYLGTSSLQETKKDLI